MSQTNEVLTKLAPRLWNASAGLHGFAVLDGASNEGLLDVLYGDNRP